MTSENKTTPLCGMCRGPLVIYRHGEQRQVIECLGLTSNPAGCGAIVRIEAVPGGIMQHLIAAGPGRVKAL